MNNDADGRRLSYVPSAGGRKASMAWGGASDNRRNSYAMRDRMESRRRSQANSRAQSAANTPAHSSAQVPTQRDFAANAEKERPLDA